MNCLQCGYIGCGSQEEIDKARELGYLIDWKIEPPKEVPSSEIEDCFTPKEGDYDDELYDEDDFYEVFGFD